VELRKGKWGAAEPGRLYGLPVVRAQVDPDGHLGAFRLRRTGRNLYRSGALQILAPKNFGGWSVLRQQGIAPIDPLPLLRDQSARLALESLCRQGREPGKNAVALRGRRAGRDMERAALRLCGQVRRLVIEAPEGGDELARWLRRQYGMPILPPEEQTPVEICFDPMPSAAETSLRLFGTEPSLGGLQLTAPELKPGDKSDLSLLFVLWEGGILQECDLKIT
jgi:hypothetical protein